MNQELYGVEQCEGENTKVFYTRGLPLSDDDNAVIDLIRTMPGVKRASFIDRYSILITRSLRMKWRDVEPQILSLFRGVDACSDGSEIGLRFDSDMKRKVLARIYEARENPS